MQKWFLLIISLLCFGVAKAQNESTLLTGIRLQKAHNFYYENGFNVEYTQQKFLNNKFIFGLSYYTSRLGSAFHSNAIKQDNYLFSFGYHFRSDKIICPILQMNVGYFYADYESPIFDVLPHTSALLSAETGLFLNFNIPVKVKATLGYNFITGNGTTGVGTIFPLYFQLGIFYQWHFKNE